MAGETPITLIGNLVADPDVRFTGAGIAVVNFTVATTPRIFDRSSNEWKDGQALFARCTVWRDVAENFAASARKGVRVVVVGSLEARTFTDKEGNERTVWEVRAEEVAVSTRYVRLTVHKKPTGGPSGVPAEEPAPLSQ